MVVQTFSMLLFIPYFISFLFFSSKCSVSSRGMKVIWSWELNNIDQRPTWLMNGQRLKSILPVLLKFSPLPLTCSLVQGCTGEMYTIQKSDAEDFVQVPKIMGRLKVVSNKNQTQSVSFFPYPSLTVIFLLYSHYRGHFTFLHLHRRENSFPVWKSLFKLIK